MVLSLYSFRKIFVKEFILKEFKEEDAFYFNNLQQCTTDHLLDVQQTFEIIDWPVKYSMKQVQIDEADADSRKCLAFTLTTLNYFLL